ncbi:hypoxanthine phosphoribosyltransferase [Paraferrimonas sp. SM1919]|uniref:hypoxanthine phosphoribosyltransferase n=1 Tax=Paraferrimonas sp. SM1919 TaxID=2662263 RepID=UPI0013D44FA4|nr:hypoxanthine phosphoribosyltransferase [Paraferrimonas sp. SM1919]
MQHTIETMISEAEILQRVDELAKQINKDYANSKGILMVALLKGSVTLMADLCRRLNGDIELDFMSVSSYGTSMESSRDVKILKDVESDINGRDVLIVEDIIDTGNTLSKVCEIFQMRAPNSVKIVTLLDKPSRREVEVPVDYVGFAIPDEFVVGYGIDYAQRYRNLPYIAKVVPTE